MLFIGKAIVETKGGANLSGESQDMTAEDKNKSSQANPEIGERGDFLRTTLYLPAEMLEALKIAGVRRRAAGKKNTSTSALIREAVAALLEREGM